MPRPTRARKPNRRFARRWRPTWRCIRRVRLRASSASPACPTRRPWSWWAWAPSWARGGVGARRARRNRMVGWVAGRARRRRLPDERADLIQWPISTISVRSRRREVPYRGPRSRDRCSARRCRACPNPSTGRRTAHQSDGHCPNVSLFQRRIHGTTMVLSLDRQCEYAW
jgi:hypothetical protein